MVAFLCDPAAARAPWRAVGISACISAAYLGYVALLPTSNTCGWCGVHYPKPGIEYPYLVASAVYGAIGGIAWKQPSAPSPTIEVSRVRPAAAYWALTLSVAYGVAGAGVLILDQWGSDVGYCMINVRAGTAMRRW